MYFFKNILLLNMDKFVEYQRFSTLDDAAHLIEILEINQIPFKIDDSALRFDLSAKLINPLENGVIIQILETDFEKVEKLKVQTSDSQLNDHFMYTLSDNDIIDAVVNPGDWTKEEHDLAQKIFKERDLKPTAELIKSSRREKNESIRNEQMKQRNLITGGASWFMWIGILSAINILTVIFQQNFQFVAGLGINYLILGASSGIQQALAINLMPLAYVLSFLISGMFIIIWKISRNENKTVYLTGMIIYGLDTVIFIFTKEWFVFGFHVFALIMLNAGYSALLLKIKETSKP